MPGNRSNVKIRAVEAIINPDDSQQVILRDPSGLSPHVVTLSRGAALICALLDGSRDHREVCAEFERLAGFALLMEELIEFISAMDDSLFVESERFAAHVAEVERSFHENQVRPMTLAELLTDDPDAYFASLIGNIPREVKSRSGGRLHGFVVPHLDYERGLPCYAAGYERLAAFTDAQRFVILGTNHFGRSRSVVGTRKDFDTPWGVVPHDAAFMQKLEAAIGVDLCRGEIDHQREHSIELHVHLLRHVLRDRSIQVVGFLCPDPCGPLGTASPDGGADLKHFAEALRAAIEADATPTCLIASADLSHVGGYFQDETVIDEANLQALRAKDLAALRHVEASAPEEFRSHVASDENSTNICSVGCIYALTTALKPVARPILRHYHQAATPEIQNCVTCAAIDFVAH